MDTDQARPPGAEAFRAFLAEIGETQSGFARRLKSLGDDRSPAAILRYVARLATGEARVPGEMHVIMTLLRHHADLGRGPTS